MGRRKIEIKAIKDDRNRATTFKKRRDGLFKKAYELSVLCSVDITVIVFGQNKKFYEFSSGDIQDALNRYRYRDGQVHEHRGPSDFMGKGALGDDDDDEDASPVPEELPPQNHTQHNIPQQHIQPPSFQHVNHPPSNSPPIPNGVYQQRNGTPQPQNISRPSSSDNIRRVSSSLVPQQRNHPTPPPQQQSQQQQQNNFAYMPNPSMYNPQASQTLSQPPPQAGAYAYGHPPMTQPPQHPQQAPTMRQPQQIPHHPQPPLQHSQPLGPPPPQHQQMARASQAYLQDQQRRQSMPPAFPQHERQASEKPDKSSLQIRIKTDLSQSPPQKPQPGTQSRSIYTPIDDRKSILAKQFGFGPPAESPKSETPLKSEPESMDTSTTVSNTAPIHSRSHPAHPAGRVLPDPQSHPQRTQSLSSVPSSSRNNSLRPQLSLQIPSDKSDTSVSVNSTSPKDSGNTIATPAKGSSDPGHSAVVLPQPSPSASAILSAGAHGPPNPFARPAVPITTSQSNATLNANHANAETPISALPSRFVSDTLLPSPSTFYPEWGFGRSGPDSNMLPSPLTFPTPVMQTGPGFSKDPPPDETGKKRKTPDASLNNTETGKRLRVE